MASKPRKPKKDYGPRNRPKRASASVRAGKSPKKGQEQNDAPIDERVSKEIGRPSIFTKSLADDICAGLAQGLSMRTICSAAGMPCMATVFCWLRTKEEFLEQYVRAKQEAADAFAEEILDIADDGTNDWMEKENEDGKVIGWTVNGEHIHRSKLRVDTRKWLASKLKPKKYGDKLEVDGKVESVVRVVNMTGVKIGSGKTK